MELAVVLVTENLVSRGRTFGSVEGETARAIDSWLAKVGSAAD
jgi:hypothetical protein